jgi:hypothetical protein
MRTGMLGTVGRDAGPTRTAARVETEAVAAAHAAYCAVKHLAGIADEAARVGNATEARAEFERLAVAMGSPGGRGRFRC